MSPRPDCRPVLPLVISLLALACVGCTQNEESAYARAERQNTTEEYRNFLAKYPRGKFSGTVTEILQHREKEDLELAERRNTEDSYQWFLKLWPEGANKESALAAIDDLRFAQAEKRKTMEAFRDYLAKNPQGRHAAQARDLIEPLLWDACQGGKRRERCCEYAREFPTGKFFAQSADKQKEVLFDCAIQLGTIESLTAFWEQNRYQRDEKTLRVDRLLQDALFDEIKRKPSVDLCERFLERFSEGTRAIQVRAILEPLLYTSVVKAGTVEACEKYLQRYPSGAHASAITGMLEPLLFSRAKSENSIDGHEKYLAQFPKGPHVQQIMSLLDPLVFQEASKKGFFSDLSKYVERFPQGKHAGEAGRRMQELRKLKAIAEVSYPKELDRGTGRPDGWAWKTVFSEKGGKIGYRLSGSGAIVDPHGNRYTTWGSGEINRGAVAVAAGGTQDDGSYWVTSESHNLCNGHAEFTWQGEDAGGHPVIFQVRVLLRHRNCPGK